MELKCGMIVKSVAGHDKDRFYLVIKLEKNRVYIADGKKRMLASLKAKNFIHIKMTKDCVDVKKFDTDKKIRQLLHKYNYNEQNFRRN